jgi:hypothetical protein
VGVEIGQNALKIKDNRTYTLEKERSREALRSAVEWLEMVYENDPSNEKVVSLLTQLYSTLQLHDKLKEL